MKNNLEIIKKLLEHKIRVDLFVISFLSIIAGLIDVFLFYVIGNLFTGETHIFKPIHILSFLISRFIINSLLEKIRSRGIWKFYERIAHKYVKNKLENDYWYQKITKKSTILRIVVKDIPHVSYIYQSLLNIINDSVFSIVIIFVIIYYEPILIISLITSFSIVSFLVTIIFKERIQETASKRLKSDDEIKKWILPYKDSIDQLFSMKKTHVITDKLNDIISIRFESGSNQTLFVALTRILTENILLFILVIFLVFYESQNVFWVLPLLVRLIPNISRINTSYSTFSFYKKEVLEVLNSLDQKEKNDLIFKGDVIESDKSLNIKIDSLSFKGYSPIINNKNILIPLNKIVFMVGKSGIGKSTFAKYISEFSFNNGDFIYLPQKVSIFPDTLKFNVALDQKISDNQISMVLESVGMKLSDTRIKLDSPLNEENLSGGQMQRIALARTICHGFNNFILDEPTNNLDNQSKNELVKSINKLKEIGSSIIIITHDYEFISEFSNSVQIEL